MLKLSALVILLACLVPQMGQAGLIGEPAPALSVQAWVKGGPVEIKPGTNIFVVEIWQTSIPGSRANVTNFNRLQNRYLANGVVVAAICDEPLADLKQFFQSNSPDVEFAVAADAGHQTSFAYMSPISYRGLPYFFIVGTNATVLWHGWTFPSLTEGLDQIISGRFDVDLEKKNEIAVHQMQQYIGFVQHGDRRAAAAGRTLLANRTNDVQLLCSMALEIITTPQLPKHDFALANAALKQAEQLQTTNGNEVKFARAVYLFETGHREEGMMQATQALAMATSPLDKAVIQSGIRTMQSRWKMIQAMRAQTNQLNRAQSPSGEEGGQTNQAENPAGQPAKP